VLAKCRSVQIHRSQKVAEKSVKSYSISSGEGLGFAGKYNLGGTAVI
jgi:hypothetical protein